MNFINRSFKILIFIAVTFALIFVGCAAPQKNLDNAGKNQPIKFAGPDWDSIRFHTAVARFIVENGYEYDTELVTGSTPAQYAGMRRGDVDVMMEVWTDNIINQYNEWIENEEIVELSTNFDDNAQGFYVPTYVIEGDPERGIEPMAPELESVKDLPKYKELFQDPEDPNKGRIYGAISGWEVDKTMSQKVKTYNLDETFNYFRPGSAAALSTSLASAIEKGEPWVGYYWEPTWLSGKYDLTLLEEPEYTKERWNNNFACEFPPNKVTIAASSDFPETTPDVTNFLSNYTTSSQLTAEALAYMQDNDANIEEAAQWFLKNNVDLWTGWVPENVADKVKNEL